MNMASCYAVNGDNRVLVCRKPFGDAAPVTQDNAADNIGSSHSIKCGGTTVTAQLIAPIRPIITSSRRGCTALAQ